MEEPRHDDRAHREEHRHPDIEHVRDAHHGLAALRADARPVGQDLVDQSQQCKRGDASLQTVEAHERRRHDQSKHSADDASDEHRQYPRGTDVVQEGEEVWQKRVLESGINREQPDGPRTHGNEGDVTKAQDSGGADEHLQRHDNDQVNQGVLHRDLVALAEEAVDGDGGKDQKQQADQRPARRQAVPK